MNSQAIERTQIKAAIKHYIAEQFLYDRPEISLTDDFPLIEQRVIDSLQIVQLISFLQEQFGFIFKCRGTGFRKLCFHQYHCGFGAKTKGGVPMSQACER